MVAKSVIPPPSQTAEAALEAAQEALRTIFGEKAPQLVGTAKGIVVKGADGTDGKDGRDGLDGRDGADGRDGRDGLDGLNGKDGANGLDGKDGIDGKDGVDGANGKDGRDGIDGTNGENGADGVSGRDGRDGIDGKNGRDGIDGANGLNGTDGKDGLNGKDGRDGQDGKNGVPGAFQPIHHTEFLTAGEWRPRPGAAQVRFVVIGGGEGGDDARAGEPGWRIDTGFFPVAYLGLKDGAAIPVVVGAGGEEGLPGGFSSIGRFKAHGGGNIAPPMQDDGHALLSPTKGAIPRYLPGANAMDPDSLGGVDGWPGFGGSGGMPHQPGGLRGGGGGSNARGGNGAVDVFEQ